MKLSQDDLISLQFAQEIIELLHTKYLNPLAVVSTTKENGSKKTAHENNIDLMDASIISARIQNVIIALNHIKQQHS